MLRIFLLLLLAPAPALAVTTILPGEQRLIGETTPPVPADGQGDWTRTPGPLALRTLDPTHDHLWLAQAPVLADGHLRAIVDVPHAGKWTLVLRAQPGVTHVLDFSGIGLEITKSGATWQRWDKGRIRPLDKPTPLNWHGALRLEIEIFAIGPHLAAQILDADSLQMLGALSLTDRTYLQGRVGIHLNARHPQPVKTYQLLLQPAGQRSDARPDPTSQWRFLAVPREVTLNLRKALGNSLPEVSTLPDQRVVVRTDVPGLEQLRRLGLDPELRLEDAPFRWLTDRSNDPYLSPEQLHARLQQLLADHPGRASLVTLGTSLQNRPLEAVRLGNPQGIPVLVVGGIHGDELLSVLFALDAVETLLTESDQKTQQWLADLDIWVLPMLNPDGVLRCLEVSQYEGRKNGRLTPGGEPGVDLNRNFPWRWADLGEQGSHARPGDAWYRGPQPGSEPEVQALLKLAEQHHFVAALSYHTVGTVILPAFTIPGAQNPQPDPVLQLAQQMARAAGIQPNHRRFNVQRRIYPVDGVLEDQLRAQFGTAAVLVEGAFQNPREKTLVDRTVKSTRPTWQALLEWSLDHPHPLTPL